MFLTIGNKIISNHKFKVYSVFSFLFHAHIFYGVYNDYFMSYYAIKLRMIITFSHNRFGRVTNSYLYFSRKIKIYNDSASFKHR